MELTRIAILAEGNLYQQVTDTHATAVDYRPRSDRSFATVQNKSHDAAHQQTATEIVHKLVDSNKPLLGATNFKGQRTKAGLLSSIARLVRKSAIRQKPEQTPINRLQITES